MEFRFVSGLISEEQFEKHSEPIKKQISQKQLELSKLPSKMSNHKKLIDNFLKIAQNPYEYWKSLDYNKKRLFQKLVFPEGLSFSLKNKECRTYKLNAIFELTNCFLDIYKGEKKETQKQKAFESHLVAGTGLEPVTFGL